MKMIEVGGGVTAAKGFKAAGVHCGLKGHDKMDLALIAAEGTCSAAAVFTSNKVKGAPILVSKEHLQNGQARAIIANSGNANTCNGQEGMDNARRMAAAAAKQLGLARDEVLVASTGVIGVPLDIGAIENAVPLLAEDLSEDGSQRCAQAIMTTDTVAKQYAVSYEDGGCRVSVGGVAKGSGMIEPNMCTMLSFITTDADIEPGLLDQALRQAVTVSFNRISIDGDTSTNDTVFLLAGGRSGAGKIVCKDARYDAFVTALTKVCTELAKMLARDGEGATKLIACTVSGAQSEQAAEQLAKSVIKSSLVKTALFGADANWGRILCALGYAVAEFDPDKVDVSFESKAGLLTVCKNGAGYPFDEDFAKKVLSEEEIDILVQLHEGTGRVTAWGCDLTYDYVKINGDYRS